MNNDLSRYWTPLTRDNAALIMIDFQAGFMTGVQTLDGLMLRNNALALAEIAKIFELPIILTGGYKDDPLIPELLDLIPNHTHVERTTINSWDTPEFVQAIEKTGRKKLLMAGITTDLCLLFPAISAVAAGYDCYVVVDASGTWNEQIEQAAISRMTQAGCVMATWAALAAEMQHDVWNVGVGREIMGVYQKRLGSISFLGSLTGKAEAADKH